MKRTPGLLTAILLGAACATPARTAEMFRNVEYGQAAGESLRLDVSVPDGSGPFPVAILVHGGGWTSGDKGGSNHPGDGADITPWFAPLTAAHFTWFSINYRLAPAFRWPACFEDVQTAIRWVRAHAAEYKGDPRQIVLFGHSAGGHLVCLAATMAGPDTRVQAVVGCAPVTDFEYELPRRGGLSKSLQLLLDRPQAVTPEARAILREMAPINHVRPGLPPFLLVQGDADRTVPIEETRLFEAKLKAAGVPCDFLVIPGAPHRLLSWSGHDPRFMDEIIAWVRRALAAGEPPPVAVVAGDGSGQYRTVQDAINAAPQNLAADRRWVILVKPGTYKELVYVQREKRFVILRGEDADRTILTYDLSAKRAGLDGHPIGTFRTPSTVIDADDFTAENLTFENSAGPVGQALAVRVDGDRVAFRHCRFLGWQDTVFLNRGRQYFGDCTITGHVDFIFGGATAWFDRCHLICRGRGYITAASTPRNAPYGFVFSHCRITGDSPEARSYLGRPWRASASVTFLDTEMSAAVAPAGWNNWRQPDRERTVRYAEFDSTGPGADAAARVAWARQLTPAEARAITVEHVLGGVDRWNPLLPQ